MKVKSTKSALLMSFTSLLLCFAMLIGCTFAWFTDSVTSGVNQIKAGNLDIEVSYKDGDTWKSIQDVGTLFNPNALWEPGHTEYVTLQVKNAGTLQLKYKLLVSPATEKGGVNVNGQSFKLSDYLVFKTIDEGTAAPTTTYTRETLIEKAGATAGLTQTNLTNEKSLAPGATEYVTLAVYMPETVGNEANYKSGTAAPEIELKITALATQLESEEDSFGNNYDAGAVSDSFYVVGPSYDYFPQVAASAPVVANGNTVVTATGKLNKSDTEDTTLAKVTVPKDALAEGATKVSVSVVPKAATNQTAQTTIQTEKTAGRETANFDIKVDGIKDNNNNANISVEVFVGKGLSNVKVFHNGVEITGANYSAVTGIASFTTKTFSDYTISYDPATAAIGSETYGTLALAVAAAKAGETVVLLKNATITETIEIKNAITLKGNGFTAAVPAANLLGSLQLPAFKVSADGVTFDGMKIELADADGTSYHGTAVLVDGANFTFENGAIIGGYDASYTGTNGFNTCVAILLEGSKSNAKITNNTIVGCEYALQVCAYSTPIVFTNNKIEHSIYFACDVATEGLTVSGNTKAAQATAPADAGEARVVLYGAARNNGLAEALVSCGLPVYWTEDFNTYTNCFTAKVGSNFYGTLAEAMSAAQSGDTIEIVKAGIYAVPSPVNINVTIKGAVPGVTFDATGTYGTSAGSFPQGSSFENVTFNFGSALYHGFQHSGNMVFKDCTIKGGFNCYGANNFTNCTFDLTQNAEYVWTYGADVTFTGCTFNTLGKAILCYNEGAGLNGASGVNNVSVTNCTFNATAGAQAGAISNQNCAAIEIDNFGKGVNLTLSGNTVDTANDHFSGEWRIKRYVAPETDSVTVNGKEYKQIALDGKLMTINNKEVKFVE